MHDHTGNFDVAIDGVNTPDLKVADNDYAVGLLIQKIANSMYANNTLIFVIEDDAQDGGDHVDSHRSIAFVAGAYVKQGAVVSTQYNTIDFVRTMEEVLGLPPMNLNDALARPMADIFNTTPSPWSFTATPSALLYNTQLPLPPNRAGLIAAKADAQRQVLGAGHQGNGLHDADRVDSGGLQPHSLERNDGQEALSRRAHRIGLAREPRGASRALSAVAEEEGNQLNAAGWRADRVPLHDRQEMAGENHGFNREISVHPNSAAGRAGDDRCRAVLQFDNSGNATLQGQYFVREVVLRNVSAQGGIGEGLSVLGVATFDGGGNYTFSGQLADSTSKAGPGSTSSSGTYSVAANGFLKIASFAIAGASPSSAATFAYGGVGAVGPSAFTASATENSSQLFDLIVAIPIGSSVSNASVKGAYRAVYLNFPQAAVGQARQASMPLVADGAGGFGAVTATGSATDNASLTAQALPSVTYSLSNTTGTINFGAAASNQLIGGTLSFLVSADGNSAGGRITQRVRSSAGLAGCFVRLRRCLPGLLLSGWTGS